jgi:hypothetical protein
MTLGGFAVSLTVLALVVAVVAVAGAGVAEVRFRRGGLRRDELQALRDRLDSGDQGTSSDSVTPPEDRAELLRTAKRAFRGVLTRDLQRDAQLAELFSDVCRRLREPAADGGSPSPADG